MLEQPQDLSGREIDRYRLLHQLGAGGSSVVYLAQQVDNPSSLFAIKLFSVKTLTDPHLRSVLQARFKREASLVQLLSHPHILRVVAFGEQGDDLYTVFPFMDGGTLANPCLSRSWNRRVQTAQ